LCIQKKMQGGDMCACVCAASVSVCVCLCMCLHRVCMHVCACVRMGACMCVCVCLLACVRVHASACVCARACLFVCRGGQRHVSFCRTGEHTMNKFASLPGRLPSIRKHKVSAQCPACTDHRIAFC
jgi:hypothetical protein